MNAGRFKKMRSGFRAALGSLNLQAFPFDHLALRRLATTLAHTMPALHVSVRSE